MTEKELFAQVRALGLTIRAYDAEYRINYKAAQEATAYYTSDRDDALGTAKLMAKAREART
jgi:hypothetical protein